MVQNPSQANLIPSLNLQRFVGTIFFVSLSQAPSDSWHASPEAQRINSLRQALSHQSSSQAFVSLP